MVGVGMSFWVRRKCILFTTCAQPTPPSTVAHHTEGGVAGAWRLMAAVAVAGNGSMPHALVRSGSKAIDVIAMLTLSSPTISTRLARMPKRRTCTRR